MTNYNGFPKEIKLQLVCASLPRAVLSAGTNLQGISPRVVRDRHVQKPCVLQGVPAYNVSFLVWNFGNFGSNSLWVVGKFSVSSEEFIKDFTYII